MLKLDIQPRTDKDTIAVLRKKGFIPAVYYGPKETSTSIALSEKEFAKLWKKAGETTLIELSDGKTIKEVLIQEVDIDPITSIPRHVDFYVFEKGKKLRIKVPVAFIGVSGGVKDFGGVLVKVMHELEIEAEPKNIPHTIPVDLALLPALHTSIHAGDMILPEGVVLITKKEDIVVSVSAPVEEVEEVAAVDLSKIEISEKKGKKEEEGAEGADASGAEKKEAKK